MLLSDLLGVDLLFEHVRSGLVSARSHPDPTLGLTIFNYTPKCQFERVWDDVTRQCRGLIVHSDQTVVARPWPKFWNYGEVEGEGEALDLDAQVRVTDKLDGSLGILYPTRDGYAVATRGSFESEQAVHGTYVLRERYPDFVPLSDWTYLFEIIYPYNRIVVDYEGMDDLVLLGVVAVETGYTSGNRRGWSGPIAKTFEAKTLRDALAMPPRRNAEGLVVYLQCVDPERTMLKIKQEDYVALHRIVTGLNERVVWERLGAGESLEEIQRGLPEEFAEWVADVYVGLQFRADSIYYDVRETFESIMYALRDTSRPPWTRKDFALEATKHPDIARFLFLMLDEKDVRPAIWKTVRPAGKAPRDFEVAA